VKAGHFHRSQQRLAFVKTLIYTQNFTRPKYFEAGSAAKAKTELVACTYQAFYYRALPYVPPKKASSQKYSPAWNYDFACLLLCDASKDGSMKAVWNTLTPEVRRGFWDGANVYVMILRGSD
jgi:hypothetical protein